MSLLELMLNAKLSKESVGSDTVAAKSTLIKVRLNTKRFFRKSRDL